MNAYWCKECNEGYQGHDDKGCPRCGDGKPAAPTPGPTRDEHNSAMGGVFVGTAGMALVLGFILGFLVRGCA